MNITAILCTYNRCESLARALDSLAASVVSRTIEWEVLVVDNNSTDETRQVVEGFSLRDPRRFRYVFEPKQGKSHALNTGIRESLGEILAFIDDDVTVEPTWLVNLTAALHDGAWAGSGGRILPARAFSPPRWLALDGPCNLAGMLYAHFDLGDAPCELDRAPYGANMAFRRSIFEKYGSFRTDMGPGPDPAVPRFNEDTEFGRRLMGSGERLRYEPTAIVYHEVPEDRIKKQHFLTSWFAYGRSVVREVGKKPDILGLPRYYFRKPRAIAVILLAGVHWMVTLNPRQRFFLKARAWYLAGQLAEINWQWKHKRIS
jgi:glucosyl-dolichyl phosphate glucuronosyltransferase